MRENIFLYHSMDIIVEMFDLYACTRYLVRSSGLEYEFGATRVTHQSTSRLSVVAPLESCAGIMRYNPTFEHNCVQMQVNSLLLHTDLYSARHTKPPNGPLYVDLRFIKVRCLKIYYPFEAIPRTQHHFEPAGFPAKGHRCPTTCNIRSQCHNSSPITVTLINN